jgi:hypothetical protein
MGFAWFDLGTAFTLCADDPQTLTLWANRRHSDPSAFAHRPVAGRLLEAFAGVWSRGSR